MTDFPCRNTMLPQSDRSRHILLALGLALDLPRGFGGTSVVPSCSSYSRPHRAAGTRACGDGSRWQCFYFWHSASVLILAVVLINEERGEYLAWFTNPRHGQFTFIPECRQSRTVIFSKYCHYAKLHHPLRRCFDYVMTRMLNQLGTKQLVKSQNKPFRTVCQSLVSVYSAATRNFDCDPRQVPSDQYPTFLVKVLRRRDVKNA